MDIWDYVWEKARTDRRREFDAARSKLTYDEFHDLIRSIVHFTKDYESGD